MPARAVPSDQEGGVVGRPETPPGTTPPPAAWPRFMAGSNWPISGAAIARSTRGSASIGPAPISSRDGGTKGSSRHGSTGGRLTTGRQPGAGGGKVSIQCRAMSARRHTHTWSWAVMWSTRRWSAAKRPGRPTTRAWQADREHLGLGRTLGMEDVEGVAAVGEELVAGAEALWRGEPHVVRVERVRDDEVGPLADGGPTTGGRRRRSRSRTGSRRARPRGGGCSASRGRCTSRPGPVP